MASKNVHIVTLGANIVTPNDPEIPGAEGVIDVALELSRKYGVNIRQGNNFRLIGYGLQVAVPGQDTGSAGTCTISFVEPNRHLVKAWNNVFSQWKTQKKIQARVGQHMRYDDFELCFNSTSSTTRTSHIFDNPLTVADGDEHNVGLVGPSDDGANYTGIADVYNSRFPAPGESTSHYGDDIKEAKFGEMYLDASTNMITSLTCQATASGGVDVESLPDSLGWGVSLGDMTLLPADNHINVMCGLVNYSIRVFPEDTAAQYADTVQYKLTLMFEGWSSIADSMKNSKKKGKGKK